MTDRRPEWSAEAAADLVGKRVLIGMTIVQGDEHYQEQMFGTITQAESERGFRVALEGARTGEDYWLPPDVQNFFPADPGEYRLRSTGEVVVDPDLTSTWTLHGPT